MNRLLNVYLSIACLSGLLLVSCDTHQEDLNNIHFNSLDLKLVTLDENWGEKRVFAEGENIALGLKAINRSSEEVLFSNYYDLCSLSGFEDFMLVYKWETVFARKKRLVPVGRPFEMPIYCIAINLPVKIPAQSEVLLSAAWWDDNPSNSPLTKGSYYSSFSYEMRIDNFHKTFDMKVNFRVE